MKEHAKKALKHDFEVAGKTIPTLAIAALFLVGTGSAALLSSFGTVSGTADVDQPIQLDGENEKSATASYDSSTVYGGEVVATDVHTIQNNLNNSLEVGFQTEIENGSSADWKDQSQISGVETAHLVYSQHDNNQDGDYKVKVSKTDSLTSSGYAIDVSSSQDTGDYAKVWFEVSQEIGVSNDLTFKSNEKSNHGHGQAYDEVWVMESSGDVHVATGDDDDTDQTFDWSEASWWQAEPTWSNVEYVALGYGDASFAQSDSVSDNQTVNITIDDVEIGDTNVDEQLDEVFRIRHDESFGAYSDSTVEGHTQGRYGFQAVTIFDVAVIPQDYSVKTRLVPQ